MTPPFPGMDPFIEGQRWEDFHGRLIAALAETLSLSVPDRYSVTSEQRLYLERVTEEMIEHFITIHDRDTRDLVTIIEVLSPTNKRVGSDGRHAYLVKRTDILAHRTNLVEIDLLRGGARLPTLSPLPDADYYAFVSRGRERPNAQVYYWTVREPIPRIPIPLDPGVPDVTLDLQAAVRERYERGRYDRQLDYTAPLDPPLSAADAEWAREILASPRG